MAGRGRIPPSECGIRLLADALDCLAGAFDFGCALVVIHEDAFAGFVETDNPLAAFEARKVLLRGAAFALALFAVGLVLAGFFLGFGFFGEALAEGQFLVDIARLGVVGRGGLAGGQGRLLDGACLAVGRRRIRIMDLAAGILPAVDTLCKGRLAGANQQYNEKLVEHWGLR